MSDQDVSAVAEVWNIAGGTAKLAMAPLEAQVSLTQLAAGATNLQWQGAQLAGQLLGVSAGVDPETQDSFVRGSDLVLSCHSQEPQEFRWQAYWRVCGLSDSAVQIDLIVSLETPLLESFPQFRTCTSLAGQTCWSLSPSGTSQELPSPDYQAATHTGVDCLLFRDAQSAWSYVEMTHPASEIWHGWKESWAAPFWRKASFAACAFVAS